MAELASTLAAWRVGGQIDESALTGISQFADITVVATLIGATGQNVVDPSNQAHDLRGPYTTVVGGIAGTATTHPSADGNATLAGRLWWTEPLKATVTDGPDSALQPSGLAWSITVTTTTRRGDVHTLATFVVGIEGTRDYEVEAETIQVPSGAGGAEESAINVAYLTEPPATVDNSTFEGRVLDVLAGNGIGDADLPVGGTTGQSLVKASNSDYDVEWDTIVGGGGGTGEGLGAVNAGDYGVDPAKWFIWDGGDGPGTMADADSTDDFQAAFDAVAALHYDGNGGVSIKFPKGRYLLLGTVTIPDMDGAGGFLVDMTDVEILHKPTTGVPMFMTGTPSDNSVIQSLNDSRQLWTWRGGWYDGDQLAGQVGFLWNVNARMVMERVKVHSMDIGVHCRFTLHFKLRDSMMQNNATYQVLVEAEAGAWPNITPASSASNGSIFENVRFYGRASQIAQLKVVSSAHTVRECTFEGVGPEGVDGEGVGGYNYWFKNGNTSVLYSKLENCWFENDPGVAHTRIDTMHQFELGFQYTNTSAYYFDCVRCSLLKVHHTLWPALNGSASPRFKVGDAGVSTGIKVFFDCSGKDGTFNLENSNLWAGGLYPEKVSSFGFDSDGKPSWQTLHSNGHVWKLGPPGAGHGVSVGGTTAALWERML